MGVLRLLAAGLSLALGAPALLLAALAQGGRFSLRLDVLTHVAPFYLASAVAALVFGLAASPGWLRRTVLGCAGLAAVVAVALIVPEFLAGPRPPIAPPQSSQTIKVIQFNALGHNPRADEAFRWIIAQGADVVVLEEAAALRDRMTREAGYVATCLYCGAVIFTRSTPTARYLTDWHDRQGAYIAAATINDASGQFTIIGLHRSWPNRVADLEFQMRDTARLVARYPRDRLILTGDFNSTPWSFARRREDRALGLIRRTRALPTWPAETVSHNHLPAPFPYLPIDHLYAGPGWSTVKVERGPKLGSDHYPVVVTLAPRDSGAR